MAIGDPIELGKWRTDTWVRRFDAPEGAKALESDLLKSAVFEADFPISWFQKLWLAATLRFGRGDRGLRLRAEKFGLLGLADRVNDVFRVGVGSTGVCVEVPYSHLAMVAGFPLSRDPDDIVGDLNFELKKQWQPYVDPIVGPRVGLYRDSERADGRLALFIGRGVFLPNPDEETIGSVEIALADGSGAWIEPRLPDGRPAGIYRGQCFLAFADRLERAPATCGLLEDPRHLYVLHLERFGTWPPERVSGDMCLMAFPIAPLLASDARPDPRGINPPEGYDAAFKILRDGTHYLTVRVVRDRRRSALKRQRPAAAPAVLEVIGILAPDRNSFGRQVDRWWIDLDAENLLVAAASVKVAKSIIISERSIETYEWRTNRFRVGSDPPFHFEEHEFGGRARMFICRTDHVPLGVLVPPTVRRSVGFDAARSKEVYLLDWLDYSGAVEPIFGETIRLAEASASATIEAAAAYVPSVDEVAQMDPGKKLYVGPLLVRVGERP